MSGTIRFTLKLSAPAMFPYLPTDHGLMMSNDRNTGAHAGSDCASLLSVRQYVGTPPITVRPAFLKKLMTSCACAGESCRPENPKPHIATTGLPLCRR